MILSLKSGFVTILRVNIQVPGLPLTVRIQQIEAYRNAQAEHFNEELKRPEIHFYTVGAFAYALSVDERK